MQKQHTKGVIIQTHYMHKSLQFKSQNTLNQILIEVLCLKGTEEFQNGAEIIFLL